MEAPTEVREGLRFRKVMGYEKALWEVQSMLKSDPRGGIWMCVVLDEPTVIVHDDGEETSEPGDFAGYEEVFYGDSILSELRKDELFGGYDPANYEPEPWVIKRGV